MRSLAPLLLLLAIVGAGEEARVVPLEGSQAEFASRFNAGQGRVRFVAIVSPG